MKERQRQYADAFHQEFRAMKNRHGHGAYSWAEGMTRRAARKIARNRARNFVRHIRSQEQPNGTH